MKNLLQQLQKKDKRKIVIIRHGQTTLNAKDCIRGWSDIPLDMTGFEQAEELGKELKNSDIDALISSDLTRTLQTASIVSVEAKIPILATTMAMRPWDVGKYTAQPAEKVHPILFKMAVEEPDDNVPEGESFTSFKTRVLMGTVAYLNQYPDKLLAFVCHHRNDRIIRAWVEEGCPDNLDVSMDHFGQKGIEPGTFDVLEIASNFLM